MKVEGFGATNAGRTRDHNEDAYLCADHLGLYVVCDGMGGHAAGSVASQLAIRSLEAFFDRNRETLDRLRVDDALDSDVIRFVEQALRFTSQEVYREGSRRLSTLGMGTTLTMLLVLGDRAVMAHVGDSRLYLVREDSAYQLSDDHAYVNDLLRMGMISQEQVKGHQYGHVLTRYVGLMETFHVDTLLFDLMPDDAFVLCTDGLSGYLDSPGELLEEFDFDAPSKVPDRMVEFALRCGGDDNVTCIVVRVAPTPPEWTLSRNRDGARGNLEVLRQAPLFQDLRLPNVLRLLNAADAEFFPHGEEVCRRGDPSHSLFIVVDGSAEATGGNGKARSLLRGDVFGFEALFWNAPSRETVTVRDTLFVLALTYRKLDGLMRKYPRMGRWIYQRLGQQVLEGAREA